MRPITDDLVHEVTSKIVERFRPDRVIAFGSYGRDEHRPDSDLDLIVVLDGDKSSLDHAVEVASILVPRDFGLDLHVYSSREFEESQSVWGTLPQIAVGEGKVVYDKSRGVITVPTSLVTKLGWSSEFPFDATAIRSQVPVSAGLYQLRQSRPYPRYKGSSNILKIGCSKSDLRAELLNHLVRHTCANRLCRITSVGVGVGFQYFETNSDSAVELEKQLLREFECRHWEVPLLNSTRGYARGEDSHFRA